MGRQSNCFLVSLVCGISSLAATAALAAPVLRSGVFGGGPLYSQAATVVPALKAAGYNTVMIWTLHVNEQSDLILNDILIASGGRYVGDPAWPARINSLKQAPTSVDRVELSVGAGSVPDFERLGQIIGKTADLTNSTLAQNFRVLHQLLPAIDAISYDDESNYQLEPTLKFTQMLADIGFKVTFTPYTYGEFWSGLYAKANAWRANLVDRVYLQAYEGGSGNQPGAWNNLFPGLKVDVGLWSRHGEGCEFGDSPLAVRGKLNAWAPEIAGGWLWLLDDMLTCAQAGSLEDYARALVLRPL